MLYITIIYTYLNYIVVRFGLLKNKMNIFHCSLFL